MLPLLGIAPFTTRVRSVVLIASATLALSALAACGGGSDATPPPNAPPRLPPSMSGGVGGGGDDTAAAPPTSASNQAVSHTPSADVARGIQSLDAGDLAGAKSAFDAARAKDPKDADAVYFLGVVADRSGDPKTAEARFKEALVLSPGHAAASVDLAAIQSDAGRDADAAATCRAALAKHPTDSALHVNLAVALAKTGDATGSTQEFETAISEDKNQPMYFLTYGHWLGQWKKPEMALAKLNAGRALANGDIGILAEAAHEMVPIHAFADCVATLDEAIGGKDAAELRTARAVCKVGQGDEPGALADLKAATTNEPKFAPAHFLLASRLAKAGDKPGAIREYQMYIKLEPNAPNAKVASDRIKALGK